MEESDERNGKGWERGKRRRGMGRNGKGKEEKREGSDGKMRKKNEWK